MSQLDPYYLWLGIPPREQPADHYRLLGIQRFENDLDVVENAADLRRRFLAGFRNGEHRALAEKVLGEVETARQCLLNVSQKAAYDAELHKRLAQPATPVATPLVVAPQPIAVSPVPPLSPVQTTSVDVRPVSLYGTGRRGSGKQTSYWIWWGIASAAAVVVVLLLVLLLRPSPPVQPPKRPSPVASSGAKEERRKNDTQASTHPTPTPTLPPTSKSPAYGLATEIFRGRDFQEKLTERVDRQIEHYWDTNPPGPGLPADNFSVRWTGWIKAPRPGRYRFNLISDDGVRLWLDGELLIDDWRSRDATPHEFQVELTHEPRALIVDYFEHGGAALACLNWECLGFSQEQPVPAEALFQDRESAQMAKVDPAILRELPDSRSLVLAEASRHEGLLESRDHGPIDLLRLADLRQGTTSGGWYFRGSTLISEEASPSLLQIPYEPPEDYQLSFEVEKTLAARAFIVSLPVAGRSLAVVFDGGRRQKASGLELVDLRRYEDNETTHRGEVLPVGQRTRITLTVRKSALEVQCGDRSIIHWTGDPRRLSPHWEWRLPNPRAIGFAAWQTYYAIHRLTLTPLSDRRQPWPEPSKAQTVPLLVRQAAQTLLRDPLDASANEAFGQWLCLDRCHWLPGLYCLTRGAKEPWKRLAEQELALPPDDPKAALTLADGWWEQAQSTSGEQGRSLMRHAAQWYQLARPHLDPQQTQRIDTRLAELDRPAPAAPPNDSLPTPTEIARDAWLEVLPAVDVQRDRVFGEWTKENDGLRSPALNRARLMFPLVVDGSYQLEVEFTREAGDDCFCLFLPTGTSLGQIVLSGWGGKSALIRIDGHLLAHNPMVKKLALVTGERYRLSTDVRLDGLRAVIDAKLNNEPLFHWEGQTVSLAPDPLWRFFELQRPAIGTYRSVFSVHRARFRLTSGQAQWARPGSGTPYQFALPVGGLEASTYCDVAPSNSRLVGFRYGGKTALDGFLPLFATPSGIHPGQRQGTEIAPERSEQAKEGYAVGAIVVKAGNVIEGLRLIYYRDLGSRLDSSDRYESPWIGGRGGGPEITLDSGGRPIIGIHGNSGKRVDSLGLILTRTEPSTPSNHPTRLVDLTPLYVQVGHGTYWGHVPSEFNSWPFIQPDYRACHELFFAHANSRLVFPLPPEARSFSAIGYCVAGGSVSFQVVVDGKPIYQSEPAGVVPIRVDLPSGGKTLELVVDALGREARDQSYWLLPRLHPTPAASLQTLNGPEPHVKLTEQTPTSVSTCPSGGPLRVNESAHCFWPVENPGTEPCREFLSAHAPSRLVFAVPEGVREFSTIAYGVQSQSVKFRVYADGHLLAQTETAGIVPIRVPWPPGARRLTLLVDPLGSNNSDHAYWCYPRFSY